MSYNGFAGIVIFLSAGIGLGFSFQAFMRSVEERHISRNFGLRHIMATASMRVHLARTFKLLMLVSIALSYAIGWEHTGKLTVTGIMAISITGCAGAVLDFVSHRKMVNKIIEAQADGSL